MCEARHKIQSKYLDQVWVCTFFVCVLWQYSYFVGIKCHMALSSLMICYLSTDGRPLWRFPHSQVTAAAPWSSRRWQGQHILQATSGTLQTPKQVISLPAGTPHCPGTDHTSVYSINSPLLSPPPIKPWSNSLNTIHWVLSLSSKAEHCYSKTHALNEEELMNHEHKHKYLAILLEIRRYKSVLPCPHFSSCLHIICVAVVLFLCKAFNFSQKKKKTNHLLILSFTLFPTSVVKNKNVFWCCVIQDIAAFRWLMFISCFLCIISWLCLFSSLTFDKNFTHNTHQEFPIQFSTDSGCDSRAMNKDTKKWSVVFSHFCSWPGPYVNAIKKKKKV